MASRYWVGGTDNWDGTAASKWALTSGGAGGQAIPTTSDDVFFDAASGANTVTVSANVNAHNLEFTGFTGTFADPGGNEVNMTGNLTLATTMTYTAISSMRFAAGAGVNATLTSNGKTITGRLDLSMNATGSVTLQDDLVLATNQSITLTQGTFNSNSKNVTCTFFASSNSNTRSVVMGTSTWTLTQQNSASVWDTSTTTNLTFSALSSTIVLTSVFAGDKTFSGGGLTYGTLTVSGDKFTISGSNTFTTINVNNAGLTNGLIFTSGTTQTVTNFTTNGSVGSLAKISSSSSGSAATLSKSSGTVSVDYMRIKDSAATGGATWNAGGNSTNVSGNSGWIFSSPTPSVPPSPIPIVSTIKQLGALGVG